MSEFISAGLTMGQMNAVVKKLGGEETARRMLRGEIVVNIIPVPPFKVWRTLNLGTNTSEGYCEAIKLAGYCIEDSAKSLLDNMSCARYVIKVDLVRVHAHELGLDRDVSYPYKDICTRALEMGLEFCPPEVGAALRLDYKDQPRGERLLICEEGSDNHDHKIFQVNHARVSFDELGRCDKSNGLWLSGDSGYHKCARASFGGNEKCSPADPMRYIFLRPRK